MENLSYKELKQRVSVIDIATYLGYQLDKAKGLSHPSYVLLLDGKEADRIYVKNPLNNSTQGYWRRSSTKGGDVISFVKENLDKFSNVAGRNDIDKINIILHNFANAVFTPPLQTSQYKELFKPKVFEQERWEIKDNSYIRDRILESRGIDRNSSTMFAEHILLIKDRQSSKNFVNIAFPYRIPGKQECVGYEIRGLVGFKSKAAGTDSRNGMWIADFTRSTQAAKNIYIAESAFDAISYYQLNRSQIDLYSSVFVSFGGSFSDNQFRSLIEHYNVAKPTLLFDNDLYGRMYDIRAFAILNNKELRSSLDANDNTVTFCIDEKTFTLPAENVSLTSFLKEASLRNNNELSIIKAKGEAKDWNDVLQLEANTESKYSVKR